MNTKWIFIETKLRKLINTLSIDKDKDINEYLSHNELGLVFETIISIIADSRLVPSDDIINDMLQIFYEMDCTIEINEIIQSTETIRLYEREMLDGGYIIATSKPFKEEVEHYKAINFENLKEIVLVKYPYGYNEIYVNEHYENIQDNFYLDLFELDKTAKLIGGTLLDRKFRYIYNSACVK
jgi:hypothetical protein